MSAHTPLLPSKAVEHVEAAGLPEAQKVLADFAAAGLIKSYALARVTTHAGRSPETIRDAAIPIEVWRRITGEGKVTDALNGGTVHLHGSNLVGGEPEVQLTGISFSEGSLSKVLARYCAAPKSGASKSEPVSVPAPQPETEAAEVAPDRQAKSPPPILPGDLVASVAQAMQVTGLKQTKIYELLKEGTLVRKKMGRRTLITVESIHRLLE